MTECCILRLTLLNKKANTIEEYDFKMSLIEYFKLNELKIINEHTFKIDSVYFELLESVFNTKISIHLEEYEIYFASIIMIISHEQLQESLLSYTLNCYNDDQKTSIEPEEFLLFSKKYSEHYYNGNKLYTIDDYRKEIQLEIKRKEEMDLWRKEDEERQLKIRDKLFQKQCKQYCRDNFCKGKSKGKGKDPDSPHINEFCMFFIHPSKKCSNSKCAFKHKYPPCLLTQ